MKLMISSKIPDTKTKTETESEVDIDERPVTYDADSDTSSTTSANNSNEDDHEYEAEFFPITNVQKKTKKKNYGLKVSCSLRVFVNSGRQTRDTKKFMLKTVKTTKRDSETKNNQKIGVFVSRLDPTTKSRDVAMYMNWTNDNQFSFKSGHSTDLCIYALTEFIE